MRPSISRRHKHHTRDFLVVAFVAFAAVSSLSVAAAALDIVTVAQR